MKIRMDDMFNYAEVFNSDVSKWKVVSLERANNMFRDAFDFAHRWCDSAWFGKISEGDFENSNGIHKCCTSGNYNTPNSTAPFIVCTPCVAGKFTTDLNDDTSCKTCPAGWNQNRTGQQFW